MAGQTTPIFSNDYNGLQTRISNVLGVGSGTYGYGQPLVSIQTLSKTLISSSQWNELRTDILKARQHQTGNDESLTIPEIGPGTEISNALYNAFDTFLSVTETNRSVLSPSSQSTRENLAVATKTGSWTLTLTHEITVEFDTPDAMRWFFNSGSAVEFSAARTGGSPTIKNNTMSTMLANMGIVRFTNSSTFATGTGTGSSIGFYNLTTEDQLVYRKHSGTQSYYSADAYTLYARLGTTDSEIVFKAEFTDFSTGVYSQPVYEGEVDGTLTSTVQVYRASGPNVSVRRPAASSTMTTGTVVVTPPDPPNVTYYISSNIASIGEGSTGVIFTVTTTNVSNGTNLYWTTNGSPGLSTADFADNILSGIVTIENNIGTFVRLAKADVLTEGLDTFYVEIRTDSPTGPVVTTSPVITIQDLSQSPSPVPATYQVQQSASIISEGGVGVTFTILTTNVANGTRLYWTTNGSDGITTTDFTDDAITGEVTVNNNIAIIERVAKTDFFTDGSEFFNLEIRTDSLTGPVVLVTESVGIIDASQNPNLSLTVLPTPVNEGGIITITLNAANIAADDELYLTYTGSINDQDLILLTGSPPDPITRKFLFTASPMVWSYQVRADQLTEATEYAAWQVKAISQDGPILASSSTVTIFDTSTTPPPTYTVVSSTNVSNEGTTVTFTVIAADVQGTFYWDNIGTTNESDFVDGLNSGTFTMAGGVGIIQRAIKSDRITETEETIILRIRQGSTVLTTSSAVVVADTSQTPTYSIISSASEVSEDQTAFTFTFTTSDPDGTYYWTNTGTTSADDFVEGINSGTLSVLNGTGVLTLRAKTDLITDPSETVIITVRATLNGPALVSSDSVLVNDTSGTPLGGISYSAGYHSFVVPANVYSLRFNASGAGGGNGGLDVFAGGVGSSGSRVVGALNVTPGTAVLIYVGAAGENGQTGSTQLGGMGGSSYGIGYNGGRGGSSGWKGASGSGGGGGGATVIEYQGSICVVAGGGGGGGGGGQYSAGSIGIFDVKGGLSFAGSGSAGKNCGWAEGGGGGGGGGGRPAGAGAIEDPPSYDAGGRGGHCGGSWINSAVVSNGSYDIGSPRGSAGTISLSWGV